MKAIFAWVCLGLGIYNVFAHGPAGMIIGMAMFLLANNLFTEVRVDDLEERLEALEGKNESN